jgi:hypothetical protein
MRLTQTRKCPNCDLELTDWGQKADPDKLFLFGFLFVAIGFAAGLEYTEGYAPHVFLIQMLLGVGIIAWSIFRYREIRKRRRRRHKRRTTPRLILSRGATVQSPPVQNGPMPTPPQAPPSSHQAAPSLGQAGPLRSE